MSSLLKDIYHEFGLLPRLIAPLIGNFLYFTLKREEKHISKGWTYEPATVVEKNPSEVALEHRVANQCSGTVVPSPVFAWHNDLHGPSGNHISDMARIAAD
jgi:hypothetical protein